MNGVFLLTIVAVLATTSLVAANTATPSDWKIPDYNVCTKAPIAADENKSPPYSGANADYAIAEAVSYAPFGSTCSFRDGSSPVGVLANLPLWAQDYIVAMSQDVYAGFHLPTQNANWEPQCQVNAISENQASNGNGMCRLGCGSCFLVSGPEGSAVFIGNEIADYDHVQQNAVGIDLHLYSPKNPQIRPNGGVSKNIAFKRVPCPVGNTGIQLWWVGNYDPNSKPNSVSAFISVLNTRTSLKTVKIRAAEGSGGSQTWRSLVADATNRWRWETYDGCSGCAAWQNGWGGLLQGSSIGQFEMQLTDDVGQVVICRNLTGQVAGTVSSCRTIAGAAVQFPVPNNFDLSPCIAGKTVVNADFYSASDLPAGATTTTTSASSSSSSTSSTSSSSSSSTTKQQTTTTTRSRTTTTSSNTNTNSNGGGCFAASSSLVRVLDANDVVVAKSLADLRVGDRVESLDQQLNRVYSPVYALLHQHCRQQRTVVQLTTASGAVVAATPSHLLYAAKAASDQWSLVSADAVRPGHYLLVDFAPQLVVAVAQHTDHVLAPLTLNDRIVVNGVAASVYSFSDTVYRPLVAPLKLLARFAPSVLDLPILNSLVNSVVTLTDVVESHLSTSV